MLAGNGGGMMGNIFDRLKGKGRKAYFEYYAREVLVSLLPEEFLSLHKTDKPDLQDVINGIGIEVTLALTENELIAIGLCDKIEAKSQEKASGTDGDMGLDGCGGKGAGGGAALFDDRGRHLIEAAKKKIERLNNTGDDTIYEYYQYLHYRLFMFASAVSAKWELLYELMDEVAHAQRDCERKYETIYVYSGCFGLWECDLEAGQIHEYPVTDEQRQYFRERAFELAGEVE